MVRSTPRTDPRRALADYVKVCNQAMDENLDSFWYRQAIRVSRVAVSGMTFRTVVYDDDPDDVLGEYALHFDPGSERLTVLPPGTYEVAFDWKVPLAYLNDVAYHRPHWYIEHPIRLDAAWASDRIRDAVRTNRAPITAAAAGAAVGAVLGALLVRAVMERDTGPPAASP